jgi:hypothetical protein
MKTLYALAFACLAFPALAWEPEAYNSACPEYGPTVSATIPETLTDDYAFDGSIDYDGYTAAVSSPVSKPVDSTIQFSNDDEGFDFTSPAAIEFAIQASDWW